MSTDHTNLHDLIQRIEALEADNRALRSQLLVSAAPAPAATTGAGAPTPATPEPDPALSRRRLLRGGALAAAAGATLAVATGATPAAANGQGQSFTLGDPANTASNSTGVDAMAPGTSALRGANVALTGYGVVGQSGASSGISTFSAGVVGDSQVYPGVFGVSGNAGGVVGVSGTLPPVSAWGPPAGVFGASETRIGVSGISLDTHGVVGTSANASGVIGSQGASGFTGDAGVKGDAELVPGVAGFSSVKQGVRAASASAEGIYATSTTHVGGRFSGRRAAINLVPRTSLGRPTTGAHGRGDIVIDSAGTMFICTATGTPGTWVQVTTTPA